LTLFREKRFRGLNLTVPHKVIAFDRVADIDPAAQPIGAINALLLTDAGWRGFNTDSYGVASALHADLAVTLPGAHVVLLGAGGAARGAAVEFLRQGVASLWIANRTRANLDTLLADLRPLAGAATLHGFSPTEIPAGLPAGAMVVNATSAGLRADDPAPIDLSLLPRPRAVFDMIYNPPRTPLLRQAEALGLPRAHGLSMLAYQGARALEIWSGIPAARTAPTMLVAARAVLGF
jgi:shikimate dehydrogenase